MSLFSRFNQAYSFYQEAVQSVSDHHANTLSWAGQLLSPLANLKDRLHDLVDRHHGQPDPAQPPAAEVPASPGTLLITEYVEGSGYNKAIELTNRGDSDLSLEGFTLSLYSNGNTQASATTELGQYGSLAPGKTLVLANTQADQALLDRSDATSSVINYNGNDAIVLTNADGAIQDIVGTIGDDTFFARDVTLRRDEH